MQSVETRSGSDFVSLKVPVSGEGDVEVHLRLLGEVLRARFVTTRLETAQRIHRDLGALQHSLAEIGLRGSILTVAMPGQVRLQLIRGRGERSSGDEDEEPDGSARARPDSEESLSTRGTHRIDRMA
jgi:hypothetical protein